MPVRGQVIAKAPSAFGTVMYWRVRVRAQVSGEERCFEDEYVYTHVADRLRLGDTIDMRVVPRTPHVFAYDMRL